MFKIYINQKKNNLFFNIFYNDVNIFYNSIGKEGFLTKGVSSPLIEFFINKMFIFLNKFLINKILKKKFYNFKNTIYNLDKKKIFFLFYIDIVNNFDNFLTAILSNFNKLFFKFDRIEFNNNCRHGGCKYKKII